MMMAADWSPVGGHIPLLTNHKAEKAGSESIAKMFDCLIKPMDQYFRLSYQDIILVKSRLK